jgi:hypothetical protein
VGLNPISKVLDKIFDGIDRKTGFRVEPPSHEVVLLFQFASKNYALSVQDF